MKIINMIDTIDSTLPSLGCIKGELYQPTLCTQHSAFAQSWIGLSKQACLERCQQRQLSTVAFAHWLLVIDNKYGNHGSNKNLLPTDKFNWLLSFRHQVCVDVMVDAK